MIMGTSLIVLAGTFLTLIHPAYALAPPTKQYEPQSGAQHTHTQSKADWVYKISSTESNGTANIHSEVQTPHKKLHPSTLLQLDGPQVSKITPSSFDWWYYDAISSTDPLESLTITLFTASATAFPWLNPNESSVLIAYLWATFSNGSVFSDYIPARLAVVSASEEMGIASMGEWQGTGFSWVAPGNNFSHYEVIVESDEMDVYGTMRLESDLAPHLPCGLQSDVSTLELFPDLGWTSLIPDANATIEMSIQGTTLQFQGPGYHDKNWSNKTFTSTVSSWYWGHGRIGEYSVTWFSGIGTNNQSYASGYVSRDGKVLLSSCDVAAVTVRPTGSNSNETRYPPKAGDNPQGFAVEFLLGETQRLRFNASIVGESAGDHEYYTRWMGTLKGGIWDGGIAKELEEGVAMFEQFALAE